MMQKHNVTHWYLLAFALIVLLLALLWPVSVRADFQAGMDAYNRGDYKTAYREWLQFAEQGEAQAQYNLGRLYSRGEGVPQDWAEATRWTRLAAEQELAAAQRNLGLQYLKGWGVPQDYAEAVNWFRLAAEQGHAGGQNGLGLMYKNGYGVPKDYAEAVKWYRLAAKQGNVYAQYNLGMIYTQGEGVSQDFAEAGKWFRLAAEQGLADAQINLALMYQQGEGVPRDYAEAAKWFRLAAKEGAAIETRTEFVAALGNKPLTGLGGNFVRYFPDGYIWGEIGGVSFAGVWEWRGREQCQSSKPPVATGCQTWTVRENRAYAISTQGDGTVGVFTISE